MDIVNIIKLILNEFDTLIMTEENSCNKINTMLQEIKKKICKYMPHHLL